MLSYDHRSLPSNAFTIERSYLKKWLIYAGIVFAVAGITVIIGRLLHPGKRHSSPTLFVEWLEGFMAGVGLHALAVILLISGHLLAHHFLTQAKGQPVHREKVRGIAFCELTWKMSAFVALVFSGYIATQSKNVIFYILGGILTVSGIVFWVWLLRYFRREETKSVSLF